MEMRARGNLHVGLSYNHSGLSKVAHRVIKKGEQI